MGEMETDLAPALDGSSSAVAAAAEVALPPGMTVRALRAPDDYAAMNRIANAAREAMGDSFTTTDEQMAAFYETADRFRPERDVIVIELDGRMTGYARIGIGDGVDGLRVYEVVPILDPATDVEALYPPVLSILERHAQAVATTDPAPDKVLQVFNGDADAPLERRVLDAGYVPVRHGYLMVRPDLDDLSDAPLPEGLEIRPVLPEHRRRIWEAANEAYRDMWGFTEPTDAEYQLFLTDPVQSDASLWQVAWDGDEVAGQVRAYIDGEENARFGRRRGYCENISVRAPWRRRGLARALIAASFPALRSRGMTEAALGVDTENVSGALRLYESCGFRPVSRSTLFRKPL
jgi:ribosomal protein S18 acetylase RimI-like enzyme